MKSRFFKLFSQQTTRNSKVEGALRRVCNELKSDPELMYRMTSRLDAKRGSKILDSLLELGAPTPKRGTSSSNKKIIYH